MKLLKRQLTPYPNSGSGAVSAPDINHFDRISAGALKITLNISGTVSKGQEVAITSNGTIVGRGATLTVRPIGICLEGNDLNTAATTAAIIPYADLIINGVAKGATLAVGALVTQDNTRNSTSNGWNYITATTGNYATGIVIDGNTAGNPIKVLSLPQPIVI